MRIGCSFKESTDFEIDIYRVPSGRIKDLIAENPSRVEVKMTRKPNKNKIGDEYFYEKLLVHRHQVVITKNLFPEEKIESTYFPSQMSKKFNFNIATKTITYPAKIKYYSEKLDAKQVKELGLEPLEKAEAAEQIYKMVKKLDK